MDAEYQQFSRDSPQSADDRGLASNYSARPELQCILCRRAFTLGTGPNEGFESICRECKSLVQYENEASSITRNFRQRRQRRRRASRYGSSESIEDLFSQQLSQLIGLVRQNHETQINDNDTTVAVPPPASFSPARNGPRSWRRPLSDNDSESVDHGDSFFGESDSNISYFGGDSDASFDGHSLLEREIFSQLDNESHVHSDTDIDPMHAGLDQWNSDDEDDVVWEEVNMEEALVQLVEPHGRIQDTYDSPTGSTSNSRNGRWVRWRVHHADVFSDLDEPDVPHFVGNSGDYLDARGFEEMLEQLAETDGLRRGAPPAAASFIGILPSVTISNRHEKDGSMVCAVCKDPLLVDTEAKQLPCLHLYHPSCILPWLSARNSCPVCRYELPTDDPDYEEGKRIIRQQEQESFSDVSSDTEDDAHSVARVEKIDDDSINRDADSLNREDGGGRRWFFLAAAPIVSIVGIALALWFRNSMGDGRVHRRIGEQEHQQSQRSHSSVLAGRNRRWWSLF